MYVCLNRGTAGGSLPVEQFVKIAADAGFAGADVDLGYAAEKGASALRDLYMKHGLKFGGWGPADWRGDAAKSRESESVTGLVKPVLATSLQIPCTRGANDLGLN